MRDTPETIANDCIVQSVAQGGYLDENALRAAIAAAIEKDRAETIERCARVAEEKRFTHLCGSCGLDDEEYLGRANAVAAAKDIAKAIRSLSTPPRAEP